MYNYLIIMNLASGLLFTFDKFAAKKNNQRIPEKILHLLEISGGVFANIILMYTIRHKNLKLSYWGWSWLIMIGWILIIYFLKQ